jgi:hypothetical protein
MLCELLIMKPQLTENNFLIYLIKNSAFSEIQDLYDDLTRVKYIKRLLIRFKKTGDLKERLILNHIIILQNLFGAEVCTRMLFYKIPKDLHCMLKSFLEYLRYIPEEIPEVDINKIMTDHRIDKVLKNLHG